MAFYRDDVCESNSWDISSTTAPLSAEWGRTLKGEGRMQHAPGRMARSVILHNVICQKHQMSGYPSQKYLAPKYS